MQINGMDAISRSMDVMMDKPAIGINVRSLAPTAQNAAGTASTGQTAEPERTASASASAEGQDSAAGQQEDPNEQALSGNFVKMAVDQANKKLQNRKTSLEFAVHERLGQVMVKVVDSGTKEVIREIPSEKILDMMANMLEMAGLLVDEKG